MGNGLVLVGDLNDVKIPLFEWFITGGCHWVARNLSVGLEIGGQLYFLWVGYFFHLL